MASTKNRKKIGSINEIRLSYLPLYEDVLMLCTALQFTAFIKNDSIYILQKIEKIVLIGTDIVRTAFLSAVHWGYPRRSIP